MYKKSVRKKLSVLYFNANRLTRGFGARHDTPGYNIYRKVRGFTLIELLITFSIMTILFVTMVPVLHSYERKNRLKYVAEQYQSILMEARSNAMAPRVNDTNPPSYVVRIMTNTDGSLVFETSYKPEVSVLNPTPTPVIVGKRIMTKGVSVYMGAPGSPYTCPFKRIVSGGTADNFSVAFKVPNSEVKFDGIYNKNNRTMDTAASAHPARECISNNTDWGVSDGQGNGYLIFTETGKDCATAGVACQKISVNSATGQVNRREIVGGS